jgi:hypothetical protein
MLASETTKRLVIQNVHLALEDRKKSLGQLFTVRCTDGVIEKISPFSNTEHEVNNSILVDGKGGILIPS